MTMPVPGVNVPPLFVQLPVAFVFAPAVNVPAVNVAFPLIFSVAGAVKLPVVSVKLLTVSAVVLPLTLRVVPADLAIVTLLNVCEAAMPLIACAPVPLNVTVLVPGVNVPPLFIQSPPLTVRALVSPFKLPAVRVTVAVVV